MPETFPSASIAAYVRSLMSSSKCTESWGNVNVYWRASPYGSNETLICSKDWALDGHIIKFVQYNGAPIYAPLNDPAHDKYYEFIVDGVSRYKVQVRGGGYPVASEQLRIVRTIEAANVAAVTTTLAGPTLVPAITTSVATAPTQSKAAPALASAKAKLAAMPKWAWFVILGGAAAAIIAIGVWTSRQR